MAMKGASGARMRALAAEQLDVADDLDAGGPRLGTVQCGSGCVSGTPGAKHQRGESADQSLRAEIGRRQWRLRRCGLPTGRLIVPGRDPAPPAISARRLASAGAPEAEHRDAFAGKGGDRRHGTPPGRAAHDGRG